MAGRLQSEKQPKERCEAMTQETTSNSPSLTPQPLNKQYRLSRAARLRPEGFGGLAYTFQDQKLYFISPPLMPFFKPEPGETVGMVLERVQKTAGKRYSRKSVEAIITKLAELEAQGVLELVS